MSPPAWTSELLASLGSRHEIELAPVHGDASVGRWTPIWVVTVADEVFVRTWYRRDTGWYGAVLRSRRARIRLGEQIVEVVVDPSGSPDVDAAYVRKYGASAAVSMVTAEAASTTLRLSPAG